MEMIFSSLLFFIHYSIYTEVHVEEFMKAWRLDINASAHITDMINYVCLSSRWRNNIKTVIMSNKIEMMIAFSTTLTLNPNPARLPLIAVK